MYKKIDCDCLNRKFAIKPKCPPTIIQAGPQGATGPTGATGPQGEIGPTGPSGENIQVRSTTQVEPTELARVEATHIDNTTYLDFYIPQGKKGEQGEPETLMAGDTTQVGEDEKAEVTDRYEYGIHYFDFKIPQGKTGAKGDTGAKGEQGTQGPPGEKGATGEQGAQGVAGPPGLTPNINATVYNPLQQEAQTGTALTLTETEVNNGMKFENNSITIPVNGTYLVSFSNNNAINAKAGDCVAIAVNNVIVTCSKRPITGATNSSATVMLKLEKDQVVTLVPTLTENRTLTASGAPSAMLTIMLIAT